MDTDDVIEWIRDDAAEAASLLSAADPGQTVPSCPGWQADDLVQHLGVGFAGWYCYNIATPVQDWTPEGLFGSFPSAEGLDHGGRVAMFQNGIEEFIRLCDDIDLDQPAWAFGGSEPARWWVRRAAVELTVHLMDVAGINGGRPSTSAARHSESIDELLSLWWRLDAMGAVMAMATGAPPPPPLEVPDEPAALVADDTGRAWTLVKAEDGTARPVEGLAQGVPSVATGSSADLLAWMQGRPLVEPLTIAGDSALLADWNLMQKRNS